MSDTVPTTEGFRAMAIRVLADTMEEIDDIVFWVTGFENISFIGSWDERSLGEVSFLASSVEQYQRIVGYVAA
jgi:hypothetical protein